MKRILLLPVFLIAACQGQVEDGVSRPESANAPPTRHELENATYSDIDGSAVMLVAGEWRGEPYVEGGASRPSAGLAESFSLFGDVDGDGSDEAVALLWTSSGGSGTFDYIAVMDRDAAGAVINTGTVPLGDRVKIQSGRIIDGRLILDVVQAGPGDAACCPGQMVRRTFELKGTELLELPSEDRGRVAPSGPARSE